MSDKSPARHLKKISIAGGQLAKKPQWTLLLGYIFWLNASEIKNSKKIGRAFTFIKNISGCSPYQDVSIHEKK
jgi:hypothetical protein